MTAWGVYVHLPWCRSRCRYCAFQTTSDPAPPFAAYLEALLRQWRALAPAFPGRPASVYFGGGTPSLAPPGLLARLAAELDPLPGAEVTIEANPDSTGPRRIEAWLRAGVTRVSVGVQSFQPRLLRLLGRRHGPGRSRELAGHLRRAGLSSWSVDLLYAVPGESLPELEADLDLLLEMDPPHVSAYELSIEPGTPLALDLDRGSIAPPGEELCADMAERVAERLRAAGLRRYEVSSFARPGHRSVHNEHYWRGRPYAGLGAAAHGWLPGGARTVSLRDPAAFIAHPLRWEERVLPDPRQASIDLLLSCLRHESGLRLDRLPLRPDPEVVGQLVRGGLLRLRAGRLRLAGRGWLVADAIVRRLAGALHRPVDILPVLWDASSPTTGAPRA